MERRHCKSTVQLQVSRRQVSDTGLYLQEVCVLRPAACTHGHLVHLVGNVHALQPGRQVKTARRQGGIQIQQHQCRSGQAGRRRQQKQQKPQKQDGRNWTLY